MEKKIVIYQFHLLQVIQLVVTDINSLVQGLCHNHITVNLFGQVEGIIDFPRRIQGSYTY